MKIDALATAYSNKKASAMKKAKATTRKASASRTTIVSFLDDILETSKIKDNSCNGLQVQGSETITKIGLAVDACMESYELAIAENCQMLITHHGIIWNGIQSITGKTYNHLRYLIQNDLNLYASHLPLDLHPQVGNNIQLAKLLSLKEIKPFGFYNGTTIGFEGVLPSKTDRNELVHTICEALTTECTIFPFGKEKIQRVAIVSGGAAKELSEAIEKNVDCYITGESIHENYHSAIEAGINVIYAGHYHTEKLGVQALGKLLEKQFNVKTTFLDIPPMFERQTSGVSIDSDE